MTPRLLIVLLVWFGILMGCPKKTKAPTYNELCIREQPAVCIGKASYIRGFLETSSPKYCTCVCPIENKEKFEFLILRKSHRRQND